MVAPVLETGLENSLAPQIDDLFKQIALLPPDERARTLFELKQRVDETRQCEWQREHAAELAQERQGNLSEHQLPQVQG